MQLKETNSLYYVQEIETRYAKNFMAKYFETHDLHQKLKIMRELSKYKLDAVIQFFYKINACTRNFSLKE